MFQIKGYNLDQLADLGDEVQQIGNISVSGSAVHVGKVYIALGLFGHLVKHLSAGETEQRGQEGELTEERQVGKIPTTSVLNYTETVNGKKAAQTVRLPKLTFFDFATCVPDDEDGEYLYLIRWQYNADDEDDEDGQLLCVFERGRFCRYEDDHVVGETFGLEQGMTAKWAVIS